MPGRTFSAGNQYRYGFNGKEKSNEIENGDYDFGARIMDPRLGGRWFSGDFYKQMYPSLSPYAYCNNDPINMLDRDGNIITDKSGRVIYKLLGEKNGTEKIKDSKDGKEYAYKYENVQLLTEDGVEVNAKRVIEAVVKVKGKWQVIKDAKRFSANCHGLTFAKGGFIIDGENQISIIIKNDNYRFVGKSNSSDATIALVASTGTNPLPNLEKNDINDASVWHSAGKNPTDNSKFNQKDNIQAEETVSENGVLNYNGTATKSARDGGIELLFFKKEKNPNGKQVTATGNGVKTESSIQVSTQEFQRIKAKTTPTN